MSSKVALNANGARYSESGCSEEVELQERSSSEEDQGRRLLHNEEECHEIVENEKEYKVELRLRTGWIIFLSTIGAVFVFVAMISFTRYFIASKTEVEFNIATALKSDFRRSPDEYILDPLWDFDASKKVRKYKWTILDRVVNPDGVYRSMITIDGQFPGPMIECNEGDTLVIEVDNQSKNATSVHFHGIYQNGTNWMDGTAGITQCPISPGSKYIYRFTVIGQSGTYFYHGHQAVQIADGLFGPLVIHSREERKLQQISYVTDRVVMLQDYYHDLSSGLLRETLSPGVEGDPIPNGALINGLNIRDCEISPDRLCENHKARLSTFNLTPNESHRLRLLNVGTFAWFEVSVDDHTLPITEVDGTDIVPAYASQLQIAPAQRYSVIITANNTFRDSFWLRARMITHCFTDPGKPGNGSDEVRAIIRYTKTTAPPAVDSSYPSSSRTKGFAVQCLDMDRTSFHPVPALAPPAKADHTYHLRANIQIGDWRLQRGFFNTSTFRPSLHSPSLHRAIYGLSSQNISFTNTSAGVNANAFPLSNELVVQHSGSPVIDLIVQNFDENAHPLHLHGHKFFVLGQGHAYFPGYEKLDIDLVNPIRRDTAAIEGYGWMLIRFVADNPGMWAFHCHMAWHSEAGLLMQFLSRAEIVAKWEVPDESRKLCEVDQVELEKGAAPKDDIWYGFGIG